MPAQARASTRLLDLATDRRIRDVRKVPRDQVLNAVDGGHRNVNRVHPGLARNRACPQQFVRDRVDLRVQSEYRDPLE